MTEWIMYSMKKNDQIIFVPIYEVAQREADGWKRILNADNGVL